jgi:hypothetical protein
MKNSVLEKALEETWKNKDRLYESTKNLTIKEIVEKIEGWKFNLPVDLRESESQYYNSAGL